MADEIYHWNSLCIFDYFHPCCLCKYHIHFPQKTFEVSSRRFDKSIQIRSHKSKENEMNQITINEYLYWTISVKPHYWKNKFKKWSPVFPGSFYADRVDWYNDTCFLYSGWWYSNVRLVHLNRTNDDCVHHDGYTGIDPIRWQILAEISL